VQGACLNGRKRIHRRFGRDIYWVGVPAAVDSKNVWLGPMTEAVAIKPIDRQKLISDYLDAFRQANPGIRAPIVGYVKPFYRFKVREKTPWEAKKYRHRDIKRMVGVLNGSGRHPAAAPDSQPQMESPAPRKPSRRAIKRRQTGHGSFST
jgi:hypothetical protein